MNDPLSRISPLDQPECARKHETDDPIRHLTGSLQSDVHENLPESSDLNEYKRFRAVFHLSRIIKLLVDPSSGFIIDANQAAESFFGLSKTGLRKRRLKDIIDLPPINKQLNFIQTKIRQPAVLPFQYRLASGKIIDFELFIDPVLYQGNPWLYQIIVYDISERKRITGFLQKARERIQDIFLNAHVGIYQITPAGRFIFANPTTARMFGYSTPEELIKSVKDVADHYPDPQKRKDVVQMLSRTKVAAAFELQLKRRDNSLFWVSCDSLIVRDKMGNVVHFEGFMTDITERKQTEEALLKTEQKLHDIFHNAHIGIYQITPEGRFIFANPATARMFGYSSPEELINDVNHVKKLYADPEKRNDIIEMLNHLTNEKTIETQFKRKDGALFWVVFDSRVVRDEHHNVLFYEGFMTDITELKHAQEALLKSENKVKDIFQNTPVGIYQITPEGKPLFANPATAILFGYESPEALIREVDNIEHLYVNPECRKILLDKLNQYGVIHNAEVEFRRRNGSTFWASYRSRIVRNENGRFIHHEVFISDITQRRRAEEALHHAIEKKEIYRRNLETTFRSIPSEIISVDKEMRVIAKNNAFNNSFCMFASIRPGDSLKSVFSHSSCPCFEHLYKTLKTRTPVRKYQIECVHSGKPTQIKEINCTPLLDEKDQDAGGAILVMTNITRLANLEKKLNARNSFRNIIGKSKVMRDIYQLLEQLADLNTTVLVTGESGTGKELIADALHYGGDKRSRPFIKVNCGALPDNLLESELFGHARGAFTGAVKDKAGRFQAAEGGTIFLDEIGDISPLLQLKLLRVLEHKEYERLGDVRTYKANVRIISATNADLQAKVKQGLFRQDLFYRLKVMPIKLPPLRERTEDIPLLTKHFIDIFNENMHKNIEGVTDEVMKHFMEYTWPGNVRELKHTVEHASILCPGRKISISHLPLDQMDSPGMHFDKPGPSRKQRAGRQDIIDALRITEGNKAKAARLLGIGRVTLYRKLKEYDLDSDR